MMLQGLKANNATALESIVGGSIGWWICPGTRVLQTLCDTTGAIV